MKKLIKLTEQDLHRIVKESVNRVLKEANVNYNGQKRKNTKLQQDLGDINLDALRKEIFPNHTAQMTKDKMKRTAQNALMNPPSVKE